MLTEDPPAIIVIAGSFAGIAGVGFLDATAQGIIGVKGNIDTVVADPGQAILIVLIIHIIARIARGKGGLRTHPTCLWRA